MKQFGNSEKQPSKFKKGFLIGLITSMLMLMAVPVTAAVKDTLDGNISNIEAWLGIDKISNIPDDSNFDNATLVEKVNYLERKVDKIFESASKGKQLLATTLEMDTSTRIPTFEEINTKVEEAVVGTGAFNLFVYIPKTETTYNYAGQTITLSTSDGMHSKSARLKEDGDKYSVRMYFDFSGSCNLTWTAVNDAGVSFNMCEAVSITESGKDFKLCSVGTRLKITFPDELATAGVDYTREPVVFTQGSNSVTLYMSKVDGGYAATYYTTTAGTCTLKYDNISTDLTRTNITDPISLVSGYQEYEIGINSMIPKEMTWRTIHKILQSGRGNQFGLTAGVELRDNFMICQGGNTGLKIFNKTDNFIYKCSESGSSTITTKFTFKEISGYSNTIDIDYNGCLCYDNSWIIRVFNNYCGISGMCKDARLPVVYRHWTGVSDSTWWGTTSAANRATGFDYWLEAERDWGLSSPIDGPVYYEYVDASGNIRDASASEKHCVLSEYYIE